MFSITRSTKVTRQDDREQRVIFLCKIRVVLSFSMNFLLYLCDSVEIFFGIARWISHFSFTPSSIQPSFLDRSIFKTICLREILVLIIYSKTYKGCVNHKPTETFATKISIAILFFRHQSVDLFDAIFIIFYCSVNNKAAYFRFDGCYSGLSINIFYTDILFKYGYICTDRYNISICTLIINNNKARKGRTLKIKVT